MDLLGKSKRRFFKKMLWWSLSYVCCCARPTSAGSSLAYGTDNIHPSFSLGLDPRGLVVCEVDAVGEL